MRKNGHSRWLKVIHCCANQRGINDFLLAFNTNLNSIFNRSWDITPSLHLSIPHLSSRWNWKRRLELGGHALVSGCLEHWPIQHKLKSALTCTVWSQCMPVPDRQTDGRTNIMAIMWRIVLTNVSLAKTYVHVKFRQDIQLTGTAEILVLPISENKPPPLLLINYWNFTSCFHFDYFIVIRCDSASAYRILPESDDRRQSNGVIAIFQDGGYGVANLLPVSVVARYRIWERQKLFAYQISPG